MNADLFTLRLMGLLRFCDEMQSTLSRWHPEHEWIVTPRIARESGGGDGSSAYGDTPARFLILAGDGRLANHEIKPLVCLCCVGDEYHGAEDQEKWLRRAAGQILNELRATQGNEATSAPG